MAYYLIVPADVAISDPNNKKIPPVTFSFAEAMSSVVTKIVNDKKMDALDAIDLRRKVNHAAVGSVLQLSEKEYELIEPEFRRPSVLTATYILGGGEPHIRAVLKASSDPIDATTLPELPVKSVQSNDP